MQFPESLPSQHSFPSDKHRKKTRIHGVSAFRESQQGLTRGHLGDAGKLGVLNG